jgi:hypothetical protein
MSSPSFLDKSMQKMCVIAAVTLALSVLPLPLAMARGGASRGQEHANHHEQDSDALVWREPDADRAEHAEAGASPDTQPSGSDHQAVVESATAQELTTLREQMQALQAALLATQAAIQHEQSQRRLSSAEQEVRLARTRLTTLTKGNFYLGGTFRVAYTGRDNVGTIVGTVDDGSRVSSAVSARLGRVLITDQLAVGLEVQYARTSRSGTFTNSLLGGTNDSQSTEYDLTVGPVVRQFLPLDASDRFVLYYQAALLGGYTEKVSRKLSENSSSVVSANGYSFSLAVQPGLMVAVTKKLRRRSRPECARYRFQALLVHQGLHLDWSRDQLQTQRQPKPAQSAICLHGILLRNAWS